MRVMVICDPIDRLGRELGPALAVKAQGLELFLTVPMGRSNEEYRKAIRKHNPHFLVILLRRGETVVSALGILNSDEFGKALVRSDNGSSPTNPSEYERYVAIPLVATADQLVEQLKEQFPSAVRLIRMRASRPQTVSQLSSS